MNTANFLDDKSKYIRPKDIMQQYGISRTTVYRLLLKMASIRKYKGAVLDLGHRTKLIDTAQWQDFIANYSRY